MVPEAIAAQPREKITESLLTDPPEPASSQTHALLIVLDESALLELISHALQTRQVARGVVAEDITQGFLGRVIERLAMPWRRQLAVR